MPSLPLSRRARAAIVTLGLALLLAGCMFSPGRFALDLDLRRDGRFSFHYQGEIIVLPLAKAEGEGVREKPAATEFTPSPCHDFDNDGNEFERKCSADELASQKDEWEAGRARAEDKRKQDNEGLLALTGGLDPADPKAAEELAGRLRRQAGYRSVEYKGGGIYLVDYAITSDLTHDFAFPAIEGFPMANAFIQLSRRHDGSVRMDAPGFVAAGGASPMAAMMSGLPGMDSGKLPRLPVPEGSFTLTTDATILANNTDTGPQSTAGGQKLAWTINARTQTAPMALLGLAK